MQDIQGGSVFSYFITGSDTERALNTNICCLFLSPRYANSVPSCQGLGGLFSFSIGNETVFLAAATRETFIL